jgi:hypothetical protein
LVKEDAPIAAGKRLGGGGRHERQARRAPRDPQNRQRQTPRPNGFRAARPCRHCRRLLAEPSPSPAGSRISLRVCAQDLRDLWEHAMVAVMMGQRLGDSEARQIVRPRSRSERGH